MTHRAPILVLGLGNELFTDEGLGVQGARRIAALELDGVETLDGGTLGLALLPEIEGRGALLVLDAPSMEGAVAGDVVELVGDDLLRSFQLLYSAHQVGISETLTAARLAGSSPGRVAMIGMVPFSLEIGYGLSPQAAAGLDVLVEVARRRLADWMEEPGLA